jgi:hypothetical protein
MKIHKRSRPKEDKLKMIVNLRILLMSMMLLGFILTVGGGDAYLLLGNPPLVLPLVLYWNGSNLFYLLLNCMLLFVLNI